MPEHPWIPFEVIPIAPCLPPVNEDGGATADMSVPIGSNYRHPSGREPLETEPEFPFSNCYHWSVADGTMDVRVPARPEGFDHEGGIQLPARSRVQLWEYMEEDQMALERRRRCTDERE